MIFNREDFKTKGRKYKDIPWEDSSIRIQSLSAKELFYFQEKCKETDLVAVAFQVLAGSIVDENNKTIFEDANDLRENTLFSFTELESFMNEVLLLSGVIKEKK